MQISERDKNILEVPFNLNEIKEAIWNCGGEKAPGPIKHYWALMQDDIMRFVKHFEEFDCLSRGSNLYFISLLPKTKTLFLLMSSAPSIS